jgi:hypothetical protein
MLSLLLWDEKYGVWSRIEYFFYIDKEFLTKYLFLDYLKAILKPDYSIPSFLLFLNLDYH